MRLAEGMFGSVEVVYEMNRLEGIDRSEGIYDITDRLDRCGGYLS
jgi:hypothetical protein